MESLPASSGDEGEGYQRVPERISQGKSTAHLSILGNRKRYYAFSEDPAKDGPVKLNRLFADHIQEKTRLHSGKATVPFTIEDSLAVENSIAASIETLNALFWMFSSLSALALVPDMKDRFHQLFVSLVNSINTGHKQLAKELVASQVFFSSRRQDFFLSHAPPNLGEVQKKDLRSSSVDSPFLFDQTALEAAFKEANLKSAQKDSRSVATGVTSMGKQLTKALNSISKVGPKTGGNQGGSAGRGRGKGKGQWNKPGNNSNSNQNKGQKRGNEEEQEDEPQKKKSKSKKKKKQDFSK